MKVLILLLILSCHWYVIHSKCVYSGDSFRTAIRKANKNIEICQNEITMSSRRRAIIAQDLNIDIKCQLSNNNTNNNRCIINNLHLLTIRSQITMSNISFVNANIKIQNRSKFELESADLRGEIDDQSSGSILHASNSNLILRNVKFHDNDGTNNGFETLLLVDGGNSLRLQNVEFKNNSNMASIMAAGFMDQVTIQNTKFVNNIVFYWPLIADNIPKMSIQNTIFKRNQATFAIFVSYQINSLSVDNVTYENNSYGDKSVKEIMNVADSYNVTIRNTKFVKNSAKNIASMWHVSQMIIKNTSFLNNTAEYNALNLDTVTATLDRVRFLNNKVYSSGDPLTSSTLYMKNSNVTLDSCSFYGNRQDPMGNYSSVTVTNYSYFFPPSSLSLSCDANTTFCDGGDMNHTFLYKIDADYGTFYNFSDAFNTCSVTSPAKCVEMFEE